MATTKKLLKILRIIVDIAKIAGHLIRKLRGDDPKKKP